MSMYPGAIHPSPASISSASRGALDPRRTDSMRPSAHTPTPASRMRSGRTIRPANAIRAITVQYTIERMKRFGASVVLIWIVLAACAIGAEGLPEWKDLFNGKDLTGWVNVNTAPDTWKVENG